MTTKWKLEILDETIRRYKELREVCDAFAKLTGASFEIGLLDKLWRCVEYHRAHTAELIGDGPPNDTWLDWYIHENDCGADGKVAGYAGNLKPVRNTKDLLKLIEKGSARK